MDRGRRGAVRPRTGLLYAIPSGKRRDFIIMEESLAAKREISRQVCPPGTKEIGGNYVGKCLRLEGKRERGRERKSGGRAITGGFV